MTALASTAVASPEFAAQAESVRTMGDSDIRKAAETSNRLLQQPVRALQEGGIAQGSAVGKTLLELRCTVEDLDPSQATGAKRWLDMLPFTDKVTGLLPQVPVRTEPAQRHPAQPAQRPGRALTKDNVALNLEKTNLWASMGRLNQYVYVAERLDTKLAAKIAELELSDPEAAKTLSQDVLFYVRQKHQDLLTQLAVSIQSPTWRSTSSSRTTSGSSRASTGRRRPPCPALRTAVIVAQALGKPELVLDQITALNTTTSGMIQRTSEMLRENSRGHPGAGGLVEHRDRAAAGGLPEHLRHHGLHRRVQAQGAGLDVGDHRRPRDRGGQVQGLPRPRPGPRRAQHRRGPWTSPRSRRPEPWV